tara:strand:+ start:3057 stop:4874 length:1818 start_codon:yes stop_codon:yes gene_type:complete
MAKVTRDTLARGTELLKEHVFEPMEGIAATLSGNVVGDHLQEPYSTFRLNLNIPYISSRFFQANAGGWYYIPFCLPPLQEHFDGNQSVEPGAPTPVLTEVSFSFDQRGEPAMMYDAVGGRSLHDFNPDDNFVPATKEGFPCYDRAAQVDIKLSIFEKSQHYFNAQTVGSGVDADAVFAPGADSEVFNMTIGGAALSTTTYRANPEVVPGEDEERHLNIPIDPKKTYIVGLNADGLVSAGDELHTALVSVQISLGFKMRLVERDVSSGLTPNDVQNIPTASYGARTDASVTIAAPSAGDVVQADTADGVSTNLEKIDAELRRKIYGGYHDFSSTHVKQHIKEDAGYEVIAVPLFNNQALGEILARPCWREIRDGYNFGYCDRAVVPITSPMTIHHVLVTNNFLTATLLTPSPGVKRPAPPAPLPSGGAIRYEVGVGVVAGTQADSADYQQVAHAVISPDAADSNYMVDFMSLRNRASLLSATLTTSPQRWEQALFSVPIVSSSVSGRGYYNNLNVAGLNGRPFFVGEAARGGLDTNDRTPVGGGALGTPSAANGTEQLLEIRMKIAPVFPPYNIGGTWNGAHNDWDIFSGYGGSWVYIIGKKHMRM